MRKLLKFIGYLVAAVIVLLIAGIAYLFIAYPKVSNATDMKIEATQERLERGRYLALGPAGCIDCHSKWDMTKFGHPVVPGTEGMGGEDIGAFEGGGFVPSKNITQDKETGIGSWSDAEIFRAITAGVDKDGKPLAPMMPYMGYGRMDEEDVKSIVAFIKTLKPINYKVPDKKLDFPLSFFVRMIPSDPQFSKFPDPNDRVKVGGYYAGACFTCHTQFEKGKPNMQKYLAGGREFPMPDGSIIRSANLTPDKETGTGKWTKDQFLEKFKFNSQPENMDPKQRGFSTPMPWYGFAVNIKEDDLSAIYDYLRTIPPVNNKVEKVGLQGLQ